VGLTMDSWTSRYGTRSYIICSVHYIDEAFDIRSICIGLRRLKGSHSGIRIAEEVQNVGRRVGLPKEKYAGVSTDNASNMLADAQLLQGMAVPMQDYLSGTLSECPHDLWYSLYPVGNRECHEIN
jgi:hypothetical protein